MSTTEDIAWAAGIFNCDGYCYTTKDNTFTIRVRGTDREILDRFHEILNVGHVGGPYKNGPQAKRPLYEWLAYGDNARNVLRRIEPYLVGDEADRVASFV